jgi:hypothetical protein
MRAAGPVAQQDTPGEDEGSAKEQDCHRHGGVRYGLPFHGVIPAFLIFDIV